MNRLYVADVSCLLYSGHCVHKEKNIRGLPVGGLLGLTQWIATAIGAGDAILLAFDHSQRSHGRRKNNPVSRWHPEKHKRQRRFPYCSFLTRFDQILLIAASRDVMNNIVIPSQNLELDFREYVSSQLHLNVTTDLFGREMQEYYRAYLFLRGDPNFQKDAIQVLKYFYSDVAMFLENNPCDVRVQVTVPECMHRLCGTAVFRVVVHHIPGCRN